MQQQLFFNASLPRAGSTLLQNIIGHHPSFYVSPTSALIDLMLGTRIGYNDAPETAYTDTETWKKGFLNYYNPKAIAYLVHQAPAVIRRGLWPLGV